MTTFIYKRNLPRQGEVEFFRVDIVLADGHGLFWSQHAHARLVPLVYRSGTSVLPPEEELAAQKGWELLGRATPPQTDYLALGIAQVEQEQKDAEATRLRR